MHPASATEEKSHRLTTALEFQNWKYMNGLELTAANR
jgi:hypothetical protein